VSSYRAHIGSPTRQQVSAIIVSPYSYPIQRQFTSIVAVLGLTVFAFPSDPTMASQIFSHGGFSSSKGTVKSGLSHLVMPFGSSYL